MFDACANGQPLKCLVVTDEWTHEALEIDVQGSIRSRRVIDVLSKLVSEHGAPRYLRSDNGPEFISHAILRWLQEAGIETAYIEPGKPWQNGTAESLNGKFRDECLSMEWFRNRIEARVIYILRDGEQFKVMREGKRQGTHATRERAIDSAVFMASVECGPSGAELFVEDEAGRLVLERTIGKSDLVGYTLAGKPRVIQVGYDEVFAR